MSRRSRCPGPRVSFALSLCMLLSIPGPAQLHPATPDPTELKADLDTLTGAGGGFGPVTPQQIEAARAGQIIPVLEDLFAHNQNPETRARLASTLVRLGSTDAAFWNYLVEYARPAIESDAPSPTREGPPDQLVGGHTLAYNQWASAHHVTDMSPEGFAVYNLFTRVQWLAAAHDPRGLPLLRQALHSPNSQIVSAAAAGLADARDRASVPDLIAAARRSPPDQARLIASYLALFGDDPQAQTAAAYYADKPKDPIEELRKNDEMSSVFIEPAVTSRDPRAIPILEKNFNSTAVANLNDPAARVLHELDRAHIASALVRLGDKNPAYWDFVLAQGTAAAEDDAPALVTYDAQGKPEQSETPPPAFAAWAEAHHLSLQEAAAHVMYGDPGNLSFLANTGDRRAIPVLRRALASQNFLVQNYAAEGLAKLQDTDSVPLIIETCQRAPAEVASLIASSALLRFNDPRAQRAAETFIAPDQLKLLRADKHIASGSDPLSH